MYYVPPSAGERFYLRLLLTVVKGPTSFADVKTVDGVVHPSFRQACLARGLLEDDREWVQCLTEAAHMQTGRQLRSLFAMILTECQPTDPIALWNNFRENICDDLERQLQRIGQIANPTRDQIYDYGLYLIEKILVQNNKSLKNIAGMPTSQIDWEVQLGNRLIQEQRDYDPHQQHEEYLQKSQQFNPEQRQAFEAIKNAVETRSGQSFFLNGSGGCGKTFVYNTLCCYFRSQQKIVLCVASSGIAALLLVGGRTAHFRFKIPIEIHESSTCGIKKGSSEAELIERTDLILWDEALMQHRHVVEAFNHMCKDIRDNDRTFGGITVVFGGDYQQILPVIPKGSRAQIVAASLTNSALWTELELLKLKQNMCLEGANREEVDFAK